VRAADLEQFKAERFDLGKHAVQGCPIGQDPGEHGFGSLDLGAQAGEGTEQHFAHLSAHAYLEVGGGIGVIHFAEAFRRLLRGEPVLSDWYRAPWRHGGWSELAAADALLDPAAEGLACVCTGSRLRAAAPARDVVAQPGDRVADQPVAGGIVQHVADEVARLDEVIVSACASNAFRTISPWEGAPRWQSLLTPQVWSAMGDRSNTSIVL
jgi:hypothetical protein